MNNKLLAKKYAITAHFYDLLDYPWERQYKKWRPELLSNLTGKVLELGSGTGRNFAYYRPETDVTAVELSPAMMRRSTHRAQKAKASIYLLNTDATNMPELQDNQFDWLISTFMCCVMPDDLQPQAIQEFSRVLKPGGKFKLLEMVYSKDPKIRRKQERFAPWIQKVYGARFDRNTLGYIQENLNLTITQTRFLKQDTYLFIEGIKK